MRKCAGRRWIAWLLLMCLLSACGSSAPPAPTATIAVAPLPAGWQPLTLPQLEVAIPAEWTPLAAGDVDYTEAAGQLGERNPQLAEALQRAQAELGTGNVMLIAFDLRPDQINQVGYPANLRIGRQSYEQPPNLNEISDVNERDLTQTAGFSDVQRTPIQIGETPATKLWSKLQLSDTTETPLTLIVEQYLMVHSTDVFIISFTVPESTAAQYRTTFDQILATLRFTT